jgi:hypothetical protein
MNGTAIAACLSGVVHNMEGNAVKDVEITVYSDPNYQNNIVAGFTNEDGLFRICDEQINDDTTVYITARKNDDFSKASGKANNFFNITFNTVFLPELPTFALPIAVMIALIFIISTRKKRE